MLGEPGADRVAGTGDDVGRAERKSGLQEQFDQHDGGQRGDLAGLDHEGVAGGECGRDLPAGLEQRVVPRCDQGADADRLVYDDAADLVRTGVDDPSAAVLVLHEAGEVAEGVADAVDVDAAFLQRLARIPALQGADPLAVALQQCGDAAQQGGPLGDGRARPGTEVERGARRGHGVVGVQGTALRHDLEGGRVDGVDDLARGPGQGCAPLSAHVDGLLCCRHGT